MMNLLSQDLMRLKTFGIVKPFFLKPTYNINPERMLNIKVKAITRLETRTKEFGLYTSHKGFINF